jgi:hypothetical protein
MGSRPIEQISSLIIEDCHNEYTPVRSTNLMLDERTRTLLPVFIVLIAMVVKASITPVAYGKSYIN